MVTHQARAILTDIFTKKLGTQKFIEIGSTDTTHLPNPSFMISNNYNTKFRGIAGSKGAYFTFDD